MLDAKIASVLNKIIQNSQLKKKVSLEELRIALARALNFKFLLGSVLKQSIQFKHGFLRLWREW